MVGALPPVTPGLPAVAGGLPAIPPPRRPLDPDDRLRGWYENELGWPTVPGSRPLRLSVGPRFDVLDVPAEAGSAALRHLVPGSPVALQGARMRFLVAAGSAEEVPGVLDWLEWGALALDLSMLAEGDAMDAPSRPEGTEPAGTSRRPCAAWSPAGLSRSPGAPGPAVTPEPAAPGRGAAVQGAAVWLRPPEPGREADASLPTLSAMGRGGGAPDLVRVLNTVATHGHRLRLRRAGARPSAVPRTRH